MGSLFYGRSRHTPYYPGGYGFGRAPVLELLVPMCCSKCEEKVCIHFFGKMRFSALKYAAVRISERFPPRFSELFET